MMDGRVGQVWEWKSFMGGERVVVVMESNFTVTRHHEHAMVHKVLHITGKKIGKVLVCTETASTLWEVQPHMLRLD